MRITTNMLAANFGRNVDDTLSIVNDSYNQIVSQKKFANASDDPIAAMKLLKSLHNLADVGDTAENLKTVKTWLNSNETTLQAINKITIETQATLTAVGDCIANNIDDNTGNAQKLRSLQDELIGVLNSSFSGRYVLGGPKDGTSPAPFKRGTAVDDGVANDGKLMFYNYNAATPSYIPFSSINTTNADGMKLTMPLDIGYGMKLDGAGKVVEGTAMETQLSAIASLAVKMDATGNSNLFDTLGSAIYKIETFASSSLDVGSELEETQFSQDNVLRQLAFLGQNNNIIDSLAEKNVSDNVNMKDKVASIDGVDMDKAIMDYQSRKAAYDATLAVGQNLMMKTIFDFMR